jgi:DNA polymerase-3 subunit chi
MTRVDFYSLPERGNSGKTACVLTEKARQRGHTIRIRAATREEALQLDELLWTFRDISFIPHRLADEAGKTTAPVTIEWEGADADGGDVLVNLTAAMPAEAGRFNRIIELIPVDAAGRQAARERYRLYREQGLELHHHEMGQGDAEA